MVLRRIDYGESDQVIKIFLKEKGTIPAIAKGIKRSKRRFPHHLEPFRIYDFRVKKKAGQDLSFIEAADQVRDFPSIKDDIRKIALGNVILEILLIAVKEEHPHPELYDFVLRIFQILEETNEVLSLWFYTEIHLMCLLGFSPNFETCLKCKIPLKRGEKNRFDPARGGILCSACARRLGTSHPVIGSEALGVLQFLKRSPLQGVSRVRISPATRSEIVRVLTAFTTYHLERPLSSLPFLQEVLS